MLCCGNTVRADPRAYLSYAWKEPIVSIKDHLITGISCVLKQYVPSMCREMEKSESLFYVHYNTATGGYKLQ